MIFISIILAVIIERQFHHLSQYRQYSWFDDYIAFFQKRFEDKAWWKSWPAALLIIALIPTFYSLLTSGEHGLLVQLAQLAVGIAILIYCLGPTDLRTDLEPYFADLEDGDSQGAFRHVEDIIDAEHTEDALKLTREVTVAVFREANSRYFAVIFWFALLGPFGAMLYRFTHLYAIKTRQEIHSQCSIRLLSILNWIPARITAFTYALAGDFVAAYKQMKEFLVDSNCHTYAILSGSGLGAIQCDDKDCETPIEENHEALNLVERSLFIWLVFIAIFAVLGWI